MAFFFIHSISTMIEKNAISCVPSPNVNSMVLTLLHKEEKFSNLIKIDLRHYDMLNKPQM